MYSTVCSTACSAVPGACSDRECCKVAQFARGGEKEEEKEGCLLQREKIHGSKVALLSGNLGAIRKIFVSFDRKILISLCTMTNFQTQAGNY